MKTTDPDPTSRWLLCGLGHGLVLSVVAVGLMALVRWVVG